MRTSLKIFPLYALLALASCRLSTPKERDGEPVTTAMPVQNVPIAEILRDPASFSARTVQTEAFVEHSEGGFIVSPDTTSLSKSILTNLAYLDVSKCRHKDRLPAPGSRGFFALKGYVVADRGGASGRSYYSCTFTLLDCVKLSRAATESLTP
jgi:hypothetical protein